MAMDISLDAEKSRFPFPMLYCGICGAKLTLIIERHGSEFRQHVDCPCGNMKGMLFSQAGSIFATGIVGFKEIQNKDPQWFENTRPPIFLMCEDVSVPLYLVA